MAKSRDKIQQLGFWDTEVSSPDHDAVVLWAYENADLIFRKAYPSLFDRNWEQNEIHVDNGVHKDDWAKTLQEFANNNPRPNPKVTKKVLEFVLKSRTGYRDQLERIVGYGDLLIETSNPSVAGDYEYDKYSRNPISLTQCNIVWGYGYHSSQSILVEAKSVLPTVGELMRQIQLYRTAFKGRIVVASPDDSYSELLEEQDVVYVQSNKQT